MKTKKLYGYEDFGCPIVTALPYKDGKYLVFTEKAGFMLEPELKKPKKERRTTK